MADLATLSGARYVRATAWVAVQSMPWARWSRCTSRRVRSVAMTSGGWRCRMKSRANQAFSAENKLPLRLFGGERW